MIGEVRLGRKRQITVKIKQRWTEQILKGRSNFLEEKKPLKQPMQQKKTLKKLG
jgi:hypothetical protein